MINIDPSPARTVRPPSRDRVGRAPHRLLAVLAGEAHMAGASGNIRPAVRPVQGARQAV
jgi:hypothetical protein